MPREYVRAAIASGLAVDEFGPRLSFFFVARTTLLEEIAKFRAARRIWAAIMRDEFGAADPRSQMLRFHTQTAGVQLTAQQPEVNMARVTVQALAALLGGTQSLHTNSYDEAIALPTEKAARLALRTQQVLAYETDLTATVDPFAGSYAVESMTSDIEQAAGQLMARVEELGGAVAAIEQGFQKAEIERSAYLVARQIDAGERVIVGVNRFTRRGRRALPAAARRSGHRAAAGAAPGGAAGRPRRRPSSSAGSMTSGTPRKAPGICSIRSARRSGPAPPWARSVTRCVMCGACTSRPTRTEAACHRAAADEPWPQRVGRARLGRENVAE